MSGYILKNFTAFIVALISACANDSVRLLNSPDLTTEPLTASIAAPREGEVQVAKPHAVALDADEEVFAIDRDGRASGPGVAAVQIEAANVDTTSCLDLLCYHDGCNDVSKSRTSECVAAMSRYCGDRGFQLGFSQEVGAGVFGVACSAAPFRHDISLNELVVRHSGCNALSKSQQPDCMAAVHRACNARGFGAGMSQEVGNGVFGVACVQPGWYGDISLAELRARHGGCSNVAFSQNSDCVAAVHRACNARGFAAGLAQEVGNNVLGVACFAVNSYGDVPVI
jgi:hypothetical protein